MKLLIHIQLSIRDKLPSKMFGKLKVLEQNIQKITQNSFKKIEKFTSRELP